MQHNVHYNIGGIDPNKGHFQEMYIYKRTTTTTKPPTRYAPLEAMDNKTAAAPLPAPTRRCSKTLNTSAVNATACGQLHPPKAKCDRYRRQKRRQNERIPPFSEEQGVVPGSSNLYAFFFLQSFYQSWSLSV